MVRLVALVIEFLLLSLFLANKKTGPSEDESA